MGKKGGRQARRERRNKHRQVDQDAIFESQFPSPPVKFKKKPPLQAKNEAQGQLISSVLSRDITFANGPAGTGKTYVVSTLALEELMAGRIQKILITRPMKGCDEDMQALPGDIEEKYAPWVRPILDVFAEHMTQGALEYALKSRKIEFAPLQFMRGSSWRDTWAILDEAQNATPMQMKMFLTRLGEGSKLIISGDIAQSDLVDRRGVRQVSGLQDALNRLEGLPEVGIVNFTPDDIVRHGLVRKILDRYER